jgi:hypothetical protein
MESSYEAKEQTREFPGCVMAIVTPTSAVCERYLGSACWTSRGFQAYNFSLASWSGQYDVGFVLNRSVREPRTDEETTSTDWSLGGLYPKV